MEYIFENIKVESTKKTPEIELNKETGFITISGISIPENSKAFYETLIRWVDDYVKSPAETTKVSLALRYMNSSTTMIVNKILKKLDRDISGKKSISFEWKYEEDDYEMKDVGEYYQELLNSPLTFTEVEEI